nr:hypothetical protein BSM_18670 [uncultured archaeon]
MKLSDTELRNFVDQDESEMLEFKESFDHEAIETAGAFANTRGGIILIGKARSNRERDLLFITKGLKGLTKGSQTGQRGHEGATNGSSTKRKKI